MEEQWSYPSKFSSGPRNEPDTMYDKNVREQGEKELEERKKRDARARERAENGDDDEVNEF